LTFFLTRRQFLRGGAAVLVSSIFVLNGDLRAVLAAPKEMLPDGMHYPREYQNLLEVENLRQIIGAHPESEYTIMWQMRAVGVDVRLEYRRVDREGASWVVPSYAKSQISDQDKYIYTAHLERLEPDCRYAYRLTQGESATSWRIFATAPYGGFRAIIVADSQCGENYAAWALTISRAVAKCPDANFIADLGDIVDNGQSDWHWSEWYGGAKDVLPDYLFVPVMGNHECYDLEWKNCLPKGYLTEFSLPPNGSRNFLGYYYDFNYGAVHFLVLNTEAEEIEPLKPGLMSEQLAWLRQSVSASNRPWQVVLMHRDILAYNEWNPYTKGYGGLNDIAHSFMPIFDELKIDLVLTGHMHTYRNRGHIFDFKPSDKGPVYILCGLSGNVRYDVPPDPNFDRVKSAEPDTDNFLLLEADPGKLNLRCYSLDDKLLDEMTLQKEKSHISRH